MFEIAGFGHAVVVAAIRKSAPHFAAGGANGEQLCHVGRTRNAVLV